MPGMKAMILKKDGTSILCLSAQSARVALTGFGALCGRRASVRKLDEEANMFSCMKPRFGELVSMTLLCIFVLTKLHGHTFACRSLYRCFGA